MVMVLAGTLLAALTALPQPEVLQEDSILYSDGAYRRFYYAVPADYATEGRWPLMVWLHGGVGGQELPSYDQAALEESPLLAEMLDRGFVLAFPCGQQGAVWWDSVGQRGVLDIVARLKQRLRIDDSRVIVAGFSDGASGAYALMMLSPTPFAGYMAFSGHLGVAAIDGGRSTWLESLASRPGIAVHTDLDPLYPAAEMSPTIDLAREAGASIDYYTLDGYGHDDAYLPSLLEPVLTFADTVRRRRFPERIVWKAGEPSACDWLQVDSIVEWPVLTSDADHNMVMVSRRISIGFIPDWESREGGVAVDRVPEGDSPANRVGLLSGDRVVSFAGAGVDSLADLSRAKEALSPGDPFTMAVVRDGRRLVLEGFLDPPVYYWLFPRSAPSVRIEAALEGNTFSLRVNRLCRLTLLLHPEMVDLGREVRVLCNGMKVYEGMVDEDPGMADSLRSVTGDLQRDYTACIELELSRLLPPMMAEGGRGAGGRRSGP